MTTLSPEEREALRHSVHRLMNEASSEESVRATMETKEGYVPELWRQMSELGVTGLIIAQEFGGAGVGPMELEAVMEEAGAALLCSPLLASGVLGAELLQRLGDTQLNQRLLPAIASGDCIATAVLTGDTASWTPEGVAISAEQEAGQWNLDGRGCFVLHGQNADILLVVANTDEGLAAFEVDASAAKMSIEALPTFDRTLRLSAISFEGTSAKRIDSQGPVWEAVQQALDLALVALAGEQAGGARKVLDFTVEYAKVRVQFGRQIGSFQAIKHMAADLLLETESATSAARHAAGCLAESSERSDEAISLAAFACADAYVRTTADSIQMHGGIGFTWEHPAHLYLRRARAGAQLFGSSEYYRERYLRALGA